MVDSANGGQAGEHPARAAGEGRALAAGVTLTLVVAALALRAAAGTAPSPGRVGFDVSALTAAALFGCCLAALRIHRSRVPRQPSAGTAAQRLRLATITALSILAVLGPAALLFASRPNPSNPPGRPQPVPRAQVTAQPSPARTHGVARHTTPWHLDVMPLLLALLCLAGLLAAGLLARFIYTLIARRVPPPVTGSGAPPDGPPAPDQDRTALTGALLAGRGALSGDDTRAAIIACYAAMEQSLARAGIARKISDSPTDFLERAVRRAAADPAEASTLTNLFREARFSTHPMNPGQLRRARAALDAALAVWAAAPRADSATRSPAAAITGPASSESRGQ